LVKIYADLHIHSKYARATSPKMNLDYLSKYAKVKGLNVLGTGDFTHPEWFRELKNGLSKKDDHYEYNGMIFVPQTEISHIYSQDGKVRKIHNVIFAPDLEIAEQITEFLKTKGRVDYDGRPIFGFPPYELVEKVMEISKDCEVFPAHAWTPWFSIFGSMSGFDSAKDCYKDQIKHIHALETGMSSDPPMNWMLSSLDKFTLLSNSDSHSPWPQRIGREANVFDMDSFFYKEMIRTIRNKDRNKFLFTIEVDPSYGKYHYDGHRKCNVVMAPNESKKNKNICPKCNRRMTIGVLNRVEELADRKYGYKPEGAIPFKKLLPLSEIISIVYDIGVGTKFVWGLYNKLIEKFGDEYQILLYTKKEELVKEMHKKLVKVILDIREGKINVTPGYDGEYGVLTIKEEDKIREQKSLKDFNLT
jgi:uncharacterized protein (TIGR00375 family)